MARMTLDQLQTFLAVAQHLHFTQAAEALYLSQPAVTAAIQSLEKQYGVKLFHRIGRRVELTDAGRMLQREAQKILDRVDLTERGLQEFNNLQQGELKLGASHWVQSNLIASLLMIKMSVGTKRVYMNFVELMAIMS